MTLDILPKAKAPFSTRLRAGKLGEGIVARWLNGRGWNVVPAYDTEQSTGKGPRFFAHDGRQLIAPDMLVYNAAGELRWIEAKAKAAFTFHRNTAQWVTGIDGQHYHDYLEVAKLSPFPTFILFLHLNGVAKDTPDGWDSPTGLYAQSIHHLNTCIHHRHTADGRAMVYWAEEDLQRLASLADVLLPGGRE
jgi:hypothetical protein